MQSSIRSTLGRFARVPSTAVAFAVSATLAACGGDSGSATTATTTTSAAEAEVQRYEARTQGYYKAILGYFAANYCDGLSSPGCRCLRDVAWDQHDRDAATMDEFVKGLIREDPQHLGNLDIARAECT